MKQNKTIIAFDIGASKIAYGIVKLKTQSSKVKTTTQNSKIQNFDFGIQNFNKIKTPKSKKEIIEKIVEIVKPLLSAFDGSAKGGNPPLANKGRRNAYGKIIGIGIGMAGQIDFKKGKVLSSPIGRGWKNINLKKIIKEKVGVNAEIDNDVKCFALGESKFGQAKKCKNTVYLAIGTSIGGAIEIDGKLYRGANNIAGEFGHMTIIGNGKKCGCGNIGCWARYVSGETIEELYYDLYNKKKETKDIVLGSAKGIKQDKKIIKKAASYLAMGLVNIINTINPEIIVIGGSVIKEKEILDLAKKDALKKVLTPGRKTKIVRSQLLEKANLLGAASLVSES
jgi:predicted NBD/HSP70 family sugar kinase